MYVTPNFRTKKAFKEAVAAGEEITVFQPNALAGDVELKDAKVCVEGPHYPEPHKWYATVTITDGKITKVQ